MKFRTIINHTTIRLQDQQVYRQISFSRIVWGVFFFFLEKLLIEIK